jgi:hypothetical protein
MRMLTGIVGITLCVAWMPQARSQTAPNGPPCPPPPASRAAMVSDFCAHVDRNVEGFLTPPYRDTSLLYGYYDHALGRGPVVTLGSRTLHPGFRGYGLLGSPGYGIGLRPTTSIDLTHYNGGPWYHKFPAHTPPPPGVNFDPGTPRRRF